MDHSYIAADSDPLLLLTRRSAGRQREIATSASQRADFFAEWAGQFWQR
jgi:hypothetical protein